MPLPGILGALFMGVQIAGALETLYPPLATFYRQLTFKTWPNLTPDISALIEMRHRGLIDAADFATRAAENGIGVNFATAYWEMSKQLLSVADYITLWRRGEIDDGQLSSNLTALRMDEKEQEDAKKVTEFFPSPLDLVRFAVREVYTPATVSRFGMDQDLPVEFITESAKAGLPQEQAGNFWAAHWELPSPMQGFQMLHRRIITDEDLKMLLKALDVMPFWRDALVKLSYNPLTRVDVRRMHAMGILNDSEVKDAYLDRGYSPDNSENMLRFTKAYNADTSTGLTRANVVKAYKDDLIDLAKLRDYLVSFGYSSEVVNFWSEQAEYEKTMGEIDAAKSDLFKLYRVGAITLDDVRRELGDKDLPAEFIAKAIADEANQKAEKVKIPTRADLEAWIKNDIIDEREYYIKMTALGYQQRDIEKYLTEITIERERIIIKHLPIKTYVRWYTSEILREIDFRRLATEMNITVDDQNRLLMEADEDKRESVS